MTDFASFATFLTASNCFLNTQNMCSSMFWAVSQNFVLQLFATFSIFPCNVLLQFLSSIVQNVKLELKKNTKLFQFSSILFDCMKKSFMTDFLCFNLIYDETVGLQARNFTTPAMYDSARTQWWKLRWKRGKTWLLTKSAQTKIGCVKSFAVKCAHKWIFLSINATFFENKCNFLTFLL